MRRGGKTYQQDRRPIPDLGGGKNWHHAKREEEHSTLAGFGNAPTPSGQITRDPTAENAEDSDDRIDRNDVDGALLDVKAAGLFEKIREPGQKEPPNRVGHEFCDNKRPCLADSQQTDPGTRLPGGIDLPVATNVRQLPIRQTFDLLGHIVKRQPK